MKILDTPEQIETLPRYMNDRNLKAAGAPLHYTMEQLEEMGRIILDPIYFIEKYCMIISIDHGFIPFKLYPYQRKLIKNIHDERKTIALFPRQSGKCHVYDTLVNVRNKITGKVTREKIGEIYDSQSINGVSIGGRLNGNSILRPAGKLSETVERKFLNSVATSELEVETEGGFVDSVFVHKTIEYEIYKLTLENGLKIDCADTHILIDKNGNEVFAMNSLGVAIKTKHGASKVIDIERTGVFENMYDLTVFSDNSTYYTNDILSHNTTTNAAYLLWYIIVNEVKTVGILAHKASGAREVLERTKQMYSALPLWLQQGVKTWNKGSIELGNGSKVVAAATTSSAIRGLTINFLLLDEFAFIPSNNAQEFFDSVYPTISSGKSSKISIFSTPNGMNHFYKMWKESTEGKMVNGETIKSEFSPISIKWNDVPGRDEEFKQKTIATIGEDSWNQEYACSFNGAVGTLISTSAIRDIPITPPIRTNNFLKIYEDPKENHVYITTVDVARGAGGDYSVASVIDITELPYKLVAVYRNNNLNYMLFPGVIYELAKNYNDSYVLIELNDNGESVADDLYHNYEYENVLTTGGKGQKVILGSWTNAKNGIRTTKSTKRLGCSVLKALIENKELLVNDYDTVGEMSNFVAKGGSYEADSGSTDDIIMTLVIFAWASNQDFFKELSNVDFKKKFIESSNEQLMQELAPIGYFDGMTNGEDEDNSWLIA